MKWKRYEKIERRKQRINSIFTIKRSYKINLFHNIFIYLDENQENFKIIDCLSKSFYLALNIDEANVNGRLYTFILNLNL